MRRRHRYGRAQDRNSLVSVSVRRGSILQLLGLGVLFGAAATAVALLVPWLPPNASKERDGIDLVFWFTTAICIAVFALVFAVITYSILKFRARPDDDSDGPPIHGHTGVEIVWTAIPAILVTAISVISGIVLVQNDSADANALNVNVTARQFAWTFAYPGKGNLTSAQLRLPVGRSVELHLTALDVIHSFWVPEFGQKQDALPGQDTKLVITPTKVGTYPVICTELCGLGHARDADERDRDAAGGVRRLGEEAARGRGRRRPAQAGKAVFDAQRLRQLPHAAGRRGARERSGPTSISSPTTRSRRASRSRTSSGSRSSIRTPTSSRASRRA